MYACAIVYLCNCVAVILKDQGMVFVVENILSPTLNAGKQPFPFTNKKIWVLTHPPTSEFFSDFIVY